MRITGSDIFLRDISYLATGAVIGQIVVIAASPILSRLYQPEDFGILNIYASILAIISSVSLFRLDIAIPLPTSKQKANNLVFLAFFALLLTTLVTIIFFLRYNGQNLFGMDIAQLRFLYLLLPLGVFFAGLYTIFNYYAIRNKNFGLIAKTKVKQAVSGTVVQIILGFLSIKPIGLIIGSIVKQAAGFTELFIDYKKQGNSNNTESGITLSNTLNEYKKFPLISTWSALLNVLGLNMPVLLMANYYGTEAAGFFGFTIMILSMPVTLFAKSISQVFLGKAAEARHVQPDEIRTTYFSLIKTLLKIGTIPVMIIVFFGPELFSFFFGQQWHESGQFARILILVFFIQLMILPVSQLLSIFEKQGTQFLWDFVRLALIILGITIPYKLGLPQLDAIIMYAFSMFLAYFMLFLLHIKLFSSIIPK